MPTYYFEAMDQTGQEIKDVVEAPSQEEAQATIKQMGYFVTKLSVKKSRKTAAAKKKGGKGKTLRPRRREVEGADHLHPPALDPAGRRPAHLAQPAEFSNSKQPRRAEKRPDRRLRGDRGRSTLSEAMGKSPKAFNRLYVNMIKAGEAGGALEVILKRLAEFQERSESLKRKVKGALVYPIVVMSFAVRHFRLHHV